MGLNIRILSVYERAKCFKLILSTTNDAEKLFSNKNMSILNNAGFKPHIPPILKSKRTIFARKSDPSFFEHSNEEILAEINSKNNPIIATSVFKFEKSSTIKIVLENANMVEKIIHDGLKLFYIHVPGYLINRHICHCEHLPKMLCN